MAATSAEAGFYGHNRYAMAASGVTVTASSEHASFPASRLLNERLWSKWKSATGALSAVTLTFDLGVNRTVRAFGLVGVNFSLTALGRVEAATVSNFSTKTYDSDPSGPAACWNTTRGYSKSGPHGRIFQRIATNPVSARYVRFTITDTANTDNQLIASIPVIDELQQTASGVDPRAWNLGRELGGPSGGGFVIHTQETPFKNLTAEEHATLAHILDGLQGHIRTVWVPQPLSPETWLEGVQWGTFKWPIKSVPVSGMWWRRTLQLERREAVI